MLNIYNKVKQDVKNMGNDANERGRRKDREEANGEDN